MVESMILLLLLSLLRVINGDQLLLEHKNVANGLFPISILTTGLNNENDPSANAYCIIGNYDDPISREDYLDPLDYYKFKLIYNYRDGTTDILLWRQKSWISDTTIIDADLTGIPNQRAQINGRLFRGLAKSPRDEAYLDGDAATHSNWHNAVGITQKWNGGIPAFNGKAAISQALYMLDPSSSPINNTAPPSEPNAVLLLNINNVSHGYFGKTLLNTGLENKDDPTANTYSIIGDFDHDTPDFRDSVDYYIFKLIYRYDDPSIPDDVLEWRQRNWLTGTTIIDADLYSVPDQSGISNGRRFKGLAISPRDEAYLDGDAATHSNWHNAVGTTTSFNQGIPAFKGKVASSESLFILKIVNPTSNCPEAEVNCTSGAIKHQYPGEYTIQTNPILIDGCSFDFPHGADTQINVKDAAHVGIDIVTGLLGALGKTEIGPDAGVLSGIIFMGKGLFSGIPDLMHDPINDLREEIYGVMADMFDTLWQCTETYVDTVVAQAVEQLQEEIWAQSQSSIQDRIDDLRIVLAGLELKVNDEERFEAFDPRNDDIHDHIDDMLDAFPNSRREPKICRALIPLIVEAMTIKIYTYYIYYQLARVYDEDYDNSIGASSLGKAGEFRRGNVKLMKLYLNCAGLAYYDILLNSYTFPIRFIQNEVELLFNENAFCTWVNFTHQLSDISSYDFDFDSGEYDFTIFSNGCDRDILENLIISGYQSYVGNDHLAAANMRVYKYYHTAAFVGLHFRDKERGRGSSSSPSSCRISPIQDNNPGGCTSFINDMNNLGKYYFGREQSRRTIRTRKCNGCNSDWDEKYSKSITCNDNPEFGSRFPNRIKTGLRYIIEDDSNNNKPLIAGYEFLCLNPNNYNGWHTVAVFANGINSNRYNWSPWFVCPKEKQLEIVETLNNQQCQSTVFVKEESHLCNCGQFGCDRCTEYRCFQKFEWKWQHDSGIHVQCVDVSSGSTSAKIGEGESIMIDTL